MYFDQEIFMFTAAGLSSSNPDEPRMKPHIRYAPFHFGGMKFWPGAQKGVLRAETLTE
jgi:hypothetical protein